MCGIAGILLPPGAAPDEAVLAALTRALAHRGPDGAGRFVTDGAAFIHTRLAIIDLETGGQPLQDGPLTLIANGEIYNYRELRAAFPGRYRTHSDCEPPLKIFARRSADYASELRGMYAIAIHDAAFDTTTLSRDLFGIKPLYLARMAGGLLFASEPQALLATGLLPRIADPTKLAELLQLQFTTGEKTVFTGIERVLPGETLTLRNEHIIGRARLALPPTRPRRMSESEALAELDRVLEQTVELHQRADVPYGMFLSSGIDSNVILAMMARLNAEPVLAFTAGFDIANVADERDAGAITAKAAGARHERVEITERDFWAHLPEIAACMDDPAADYAIIPSWFLARRARQDVKIILSGEGGDELFAGYGRYRAAARPLFPKRMRAKGIFTGLGVLRDESEHWRAGIAAAERQSAGTRLHRAQLTDIADWLPHDLLLKLDRCLMAHAVEGRTPFIDKELAGFAFSLPDRLRARHGLGKFLLRMWLQKFFPAARPFARKQGFDVPVGAWIAARAEPLAELLVRQPIVRQVTRPETIAPLLARAGQKREGFAAWSLLFLALWHRRHILDLPEAGDVFATLEAI